MGVRILFLGPLRDLAGQDECEVAVPLDWDGLLAAVNPAVAEQLRWSQPAAQARCWRTRPSCRRGMATRLHCCRR